MACEQEQVHGTGHQYEGEEPSFVLGRVVMSTFAQWPQQLR